ncbi:MAG: hypothetical protein IJF25_00825 [Oscillospiraceae bacterium]|nr:hypothetical protein [Oscillospiraceae bacterium]
MKDQLKNNIIPLLMLIAGAAAMYCAIMYISSGTVIPVASPLSLSFFMGLSIVSELQSRKRRWLLVCLTVGTVLCLACAVAQAVGFI